MFICHQGPEVNLVRHITERLQRANLVVSADHQMREAGEPWPRVLATLRGARGVLLLLTPGFEESPWCLEEARAVAARLAAARGSAAAQAAILPVFIGREASWDEEKLLAALVEFWAGPEHSDFAQQRADEPDLAAGLVERWREALRCVGHASYTMHSFEPCRCEPRQVSPVWLCVWCNEQAHDTEACRPQLRCGDCGRFAKPLSGCLSPVSAPSGRACGGCARRCGRAPVTAAQAQG